MDFIRKNLKILIPNVILNVAIIITVALGLYARFYSAKNGIGFYIDDHYLIRQVVNNSYFQLLTSSMSDCQVCPPLYVVMLKFIYNHFGLNHFALGGCSLISSCLSLIFMPFVTYKVCKNKFAVFISSFILAFHPHLLYFTQRIKQYSLDIFLTIFLIWLGYKLFSSPLTKKKMALFTIISVICGLMSYTSIIVIACLCFYYLFLFKKDNFKTKIINFLIFIVPCLVIFIPYIRNVGINSYGGCSQYFFECGHSHISNLQQFKLFTYFLFGGSYENMQYDGHPYLLYCNHFGYLFIPIILSITIIFLKQDKYLFSVFILPVIICQILGIIHIYPLGYDRTSLWIIPIFIIFFVLPCKYIKFNEKIIYNILSVILIIYYLFIFDKASIVSIKNYFSDNYQQNTTNLFVENLLKSDICNDDIIFITTDLMNENHKDFILDIFDEHNVLRKNPKIYAYDFSLSENKLSLKLDELSFNKNIYFYLYKDGNTANDKSNLDYYYLMIKNNMNIIYEYETWYGDKFIKARMN